MNKWKSLVLSALLTVVLLVVLIANVELEQVLQALRKVELSYIIPAFFFHLSAYFFRTWSFYLFITDKKISFTELLAVHFKHNFYVHLIPASLGEFSFPILLKKKLSAGESLSILLISRVATMVFTLVLFLISLLVVFDFNERLDFNFTQWLFYFAIILFVGFIFFLLRKKIIFLLQRNNLVKKVIDKGISFYNKIRTNLLSLRNIYSILSFLVAVLMSILATSFFFLFILSGMEMELSLFQIIFISSIGVAFIILPIKSIGGFGTTEGAWTIGLMLLGFTKELSISAGFVVHIYALINVTIIFGLGFLMSFFFSKNNTNAIQKEQ